MAELREIDPEAFDPGFAYPTFLTQDLATLQLTTDPHTSHWWRGIVGAHLKRERSDIQHLVDLTDNEEQFRGSLMITDSAAAERRGKAPPRITTWHELIHFLKRLEVFTGEWFPRNYLHARTKALRAILHQQAHIYSGNAEWIHSKASQIVWYLKKLEMMEFRTALRYSDFGRADEHPPFFELGQDDLAGIQQLLSPAFHYDHELPDGLKPRPAPARPPAPTPAPRAPSGPPAGPPPHRPRGNGERDRHRPQPITKANFSPPLQQFWDGASEAVKRASLKVILAKANTSNTDVLRSLGLQGRHCLHLQIKGVCSHPACRNPHDVNAAVASANAARVAEILQRGAAAL